MKKANALLLLLVVLTAFCLAGCGKDDDGDSSKNKTETTATPTSKPGDATATPTEAAKDEPTGTPKPTIAPEEAMKTPVWSYTDKNFEAAIPKATAKDAVDPVGTSYTRYTLGLCKSKDAVYDALRKDAYFSSIGPLAIYKLEKGYRDRKVGQWQHIMLTESIFPVAAKEEGSLGIEGYVSSKVTYAYEPEVFDDEHHMEVFFENVDITEPKVQADVERVVKTVFGDELGDIILHAKDPKAANFESRPNDLNTEIRKDGVRYIFRRQMNVYNPYNANLSFALTAEPENYKIVYGYGDYKPLVANYKMLPNKVFGGDIGGQNFLDFTTFADRYCGDGNKLLLSADATYEIKQIVSDDGREVYLAKFDTRPIKLTYHVGLTDGKPDSLSFADFSCITKAFPEAASEGEISPELITELNRCMESLLGVNPQITLDKLAKEEDYPAYYSGDIAVTYKMLGQDITSTFHFQVDGDTKFDNYGHFKNK